MLEPRNDLVYESTKTYTHSVGLSSCFRQWRADSHCNQLHGYSLEVRLTFTAHELDVRNWVVDFGSLKSLKGWLENMFDHKTLVAEDDPHIDSFHYLERRKLIEMRIVPATGCEAFSRMIYEYAEGWLQDNGYYPRVQLTSVEVKEHQGNSAICRKQLPYMQELSKGFT
jgi:6-pyruvoyltetrahydropterin/6-carboxytetrahydropterin synthase